jgi:hypothetical protein
MRSVLVTVGCTGVALGALAVPGYAAGSVALMAGSVTTASAPMGVPDQDCRNAGGSANTFGSHTVCEGGQRSGEYEPPPPAGRPARGAHPAR